MSPTYDHRALRRASDPSALAAWWLGLAVGVAAVVGVALDACGATAQPGGVRDPLLVISVYGSDQRGITGIIRVSGDRPLRNTESVGAHGGSGSSSYAGLRIATWKVSGVNGEGGEGSTPVIPPSSPARDPVVGVLSWGDGAGPRRVEIAERDLLWGARMLLGSQQGGAVAGGNVATDARLWAAAQRHALQCDRDLRAGRPCRWRRFSDSFRAYSTAIAPQWSSRGWCAVGGLHAGTAMCSPARLRRRAWVVSRTWRDIATCCRDLRGYLRAWARGERANPVPGACHTDQAGGLVDGVVVGSNAYRCDRESCRWPAGHVRVAAP